MKIVRATICLTGIGLLAACSEPPPPVSVAQFMENPRLLEATMVRCGQNRSEMKYETECVNARDAVNRLERAEERARRADLEAQSERKRQALRRTQEAAAAARRRAMEEQRRREEAEYLGIFDGESAGEAATQPASSNAPSATVVPATQPAPANEPAPVPVESADAVPEQAPTGLDEVREALRRRQQEEGGNR